MHGGAPGSGAPSGSRNGNYRHGHFTASAFANFTKLRVGALYVGGGTLFIGQAKKTSLACGAAQPILSIAASREYQTPVVNVLVRQFLHIHRPADCPDVYALFAS